MLSLTKEQVGDEGGVVIENGARELSVHRAVFVLLVLLLLYLLKEETGRESVCGGKMVVGWGKDASR